MILAAELLDQGLLPDFRTVPALLEEHNLPMVVPQRAETAVSGPVEELFTRPYGIPHQGEQQAGLR
jgi:hypothetical protein